MSTHPNVILLLTLTPEGLTRKTRKDIMAECHVEKEDDYIKIGNQDYHHEVMEEDYNEDYQISAKEGDIIIFDLVTYGYGESISWDDLSAQKQELEEWAKGICERHHCSFKINVTANYW